MSIKKGQIIEVENKGRKNFSNASKKYFVGYIDICGDTTPVCLTEHEISLITERAQKNTEDIPPLHKPWWKFW